MTSGQPKRKRGVVLTPTGRQTLQEAIAVWEEDNFGEKLTIEELSDRTKLDAGTVAKVLDCEEGVDRRTLERFFQAFGLALSEKDYSRPTSSVDKRPAKETRIDWGEAVDASIFYGRTSELETLEKWIVSDLCRLVALLGMGGIGKTSLASKLGERVQNEFDYVVWRSLREAPPLKEILTSLVQFLSNQQETEADLPESLGGRITKLLDYLRSHRCLVVLDNAESILQEGQAGVYREGYEGYGELLRRVGESSHQSCLLITSREKPRELSPMEGEAFLVRSLQLRGVEGTDGKEILKAKGLNLSKNNKGDELIRRCAGNPLALKLIATTIQDLFDGDIVEFLNQETIAFEGIRDLLDQHFNRLSDLEKSVMYWLAINREPVCVQELQEDIVPSVTKPKLLEALKGLVGRSLVEKGNLGYTLQNVIIEYSTEKFVSEAKEEIRNQNNNVINHYALVKATTKDYIRETQTRFILEPILEVIRANIGKQSIRNWSNQVLADLRTQTLSRLLNGYATGNLINLLLELGESLTGYDFSYLTIKQANLQGVTLQHTNFAHSEILQSTFSETFSNIHSVAVSHDGELLAGSDANGQIRIWQLADGKQIWNLQEHKFRVLSVAFNPKNYLLASGSADRTIRIWDVETSECLKTLNGHADRVFSVAFSPDGQFLASSSLDRTIRIWHVETGECLRILEGHSEQVGSVKFSPDGETIASGGDQTIRIWHLKTGQCLKVLQGHYDRVKSIAWSPDGATLVSGSIDETARIWDVNTGECLKIIQGHIGRVSSVAFSSDYKSFATAGMDRVVRLWDVSTGSCLKSLEGHSHWIESIVFNPQSQLLASGSSDQTVKLWDVNNGKCLKTFQGYGVDWVWSVRFSHNGQIIASGSNNHVCLWDVKTGACIKHLQNNVGRVWSVDFGTQGETLAIGSDDQTIKIWNLSSGENVKTLKGHTGLVKCVRFSPDNSVLASSSSDHTVRLWDVTTGECIRTFTQHTRSPQSVSFSVDGEVFASASYDQTVRLWDVATGECLKVLEGHTDQLHDVVFHPTDDIVASSSYDRTIKLWSVSIGKCIKTLYGHTHGVSSIIFTSDGKTLISCSIDQTIKFWDVRTGKCLRTLEGHLSAVYSIALNPLNTILASGSQDETIKFWNIHTGDCLRTVRFPRLYEEMNITGVTGLTEAQKASLIALGAVEPR